MDNSDRLQQVAETVKKLASYYPNDLEVRETMDWHSRRGESKPEMTSNTYVNNKANFLIAHQELGFRLNLDKKVDGSEVSDYFNNLSSIATVLKSKQTAGIRLGVDELDIEVARDIKYLDKIIPELEKTRPVLEEYVKNRTDRISDMTDETEIAENKSTRLERGMTGLLASENKARETSPSFRDRLKNRISVDKILEKENEALGKETPPYR